MLLGSMLFDAGHSDDPRLGSMGYGVDMFTTPALAEFGVDEPPEQGAVLARPERLRCCTQVRIQGDLPKL